MQLIKIQSNDFDYDLISNDKSYLEKVIEEKRLVGIKILSDETINETIIIKFSDGETYAWCDDIFGQMKIMDN